MLARFLIVCLAISFALLLWAGLALCALFGCSEWWSVPLALLGMLLIDALSVGWSFALAGQYAGGAPDSLLLLVGELLEAGEGPVQVGAPSLTPLRGGRARS